MGEAKNSALRLSLDRRLRLEFHGAKRSRVTLVCLPIASRMRCWD
jgi:hypothetical protein